MPYNAAERKDVRRAEKVAKLADRQRVEVITNIMSTIPGRAWMLDRLERCHIFATTFVNDALITAFGEGQRNIGLQDIDDIMQACPDKYILMMRERNERDASRSTPSERSSGSNPDGGDSESGAAEDGTGSEAAA